MDRRSKRHRSAICIVAAIAVLTAACSRNTNQRSDQAFEHAQILVRQSELDKALEVVEGELAASPDEHSERAWKFRLLKAEILLARADLDSAAPLLGASLPLESARLRAQQRYLQAKAEVVRGALAQALTTLETARRAAPSAADLQLDIDILEGQVRLRLGKWGEGEEQLHAAVERASRLGDTYRKALALNNLGMGRLIRGRFDEALAWFEQVIALSDLRRTSVFAAALNNAGICYSRLGNLDRAVRVQQEAVDIHKRGSRIAYQSALGELGTTYLLKQDLERATTHLREAFAVATQAQLMADATVWANNLAETYIDYGQFDEAERFNNEARRLTPPERAGKLVFNTLHSARIASGRGQHHEASRLFTLALAADAEPSVRWSAHAGLANVAAATGNANLATREFESALETIQKTRSDLLKTDYKLSFLTRLVAFFQNYVDWLVDQNRIEKALEIAESSRARVLSERHGAQTTQQASTAALRALSQQSGAVLLSYWLSPRRSSLWIVDATGIRHVPLPPAKEIEDLVAQHEATIHNSLSNPLAEANTAGDRLYELLVQPASSRLSAGAQVVIVPDGALHRLNFETLPVRGPTRHYWIEDVEIQIAPSLSMLSAQQPAASTRPSLLLIGDAPAREPEFPALRYASAEIANVAKHFAAEGVSTHQRDRAVPDAYRNAPLDRFNVIHFTAHAVANTESPLDSAIMLSGPRDAFKLYARDVADRPLNADLVTVSACRSAGERTYSGEGLVGFSWAFLRAGARRVIAGLWDVDDRSTADLMDRVYAAIARGVPAPRALREAKLAALRSGGTFAKPYYWAPFEVFTVVLEAKPSKSGTQSTSARLRAPAAPTHTSPAF